MEPLLFQNYRLVIAYDGTHYYGWQIQPNGPTIQEKIKEAIQILVQHDVTLIGSGRTDSGVHALGQVAHFHSRPIKNIDGFSHSLNALLPSDIRIKEAAVVPQDFHAQYSAKGKIYHYHICLDRVQNPFQRLYSAHILYRLDLSLLEKAASLFIGTHNFSAFANNNQEGTASHDSVRTLYRLDIIPEPNGLRLEFEGDGFLYKMVRNIVGTLLEVSRGIRPLNDIPAIFNSCDRRRAGSVAPAHGLFLVKVIY